MDFAKVVNIMEDIKDKIPEGKYLELYDEIQKAHNTDEEEGGIRHEIKVIYNIAIEVINLQEIELPSDWDNSDMDWSSHEDDHGPNGVEYDEEQIEENISIYLTEEVETLLDYESLATVASYELRDIIHSRTKNNWWSYLDCSENIGILNDYIINKREELAEKKRLGLIEYRIHPLKIACIGIVPV